MELNIAITPVNINQRPPQLPKQKVKGTWKKRRFVEIRRRLKANKKPGSKGVLVQAKDALSHEFASGIEESTVDNATDSGHKEYRQDKKRRKTSDSLEKLKSLPNVVIEGRPAVGSQKTYVARDPVKRPRADNPAPSAAIYQSNQTPKAIKAALSVIGTSDGQAPLKDKESEKQGADDVSKAKTEDEFFDSQGFESTGLYRSICYHLTSRMGLKMPTKIQAKLLSSMLNLEEGQASIDILVRSATGSGKTLAYLLPIGHYMLNRARRISREDGTMAIVMVPTRELADQVEDVLQHLVRPWHWIVTGSVVGGENKKKEKARLRKGVNILVGTPGRLLDHMRNTRSFEYGRCEFLVLDEADRLLDLGFEEEVKEIIERIDSRTKYLSRTDKVIRSNILLSATLRKDISRLAEFSLRSPMEVAVDNQNGKPGLSFAMPTKLNQHFCIVEQRHRLVTLACFLRLRALKDVAPAGGDSEQITSRICKIIVFFSTCDSVDFHYELFKRMTVPKKLCSETEEHTSKQPFVPLDVYRIHGNHAQAERSGSLRGFRKSNRAVLLCTDVAARGLDLKGLTFTIQYDPPTGGQGEELEYLHRAGRTARIGAHGDALLFLLPSEKAYVTKLESKGVSIAEISSSAALAALDPKVNLNEQKSISYATRFVTSVVQEYLEILVQGSDEMKRMAVTGYQAYCRAYATHARDVKYFFHVRNLHLGHVARAFTLSDKPAEFSELMRELKKSKLEEGAKEATSDHPATTLGSGGGSRAPVNREKQGFNNQNTALARRRREKGRGVEAMKELAMEFAS